MTTYKLRFLISTDSWEQVKKLFSDDLGIIKDKKDDSVIPMRDHYVVEVEMNKDELSDEFYEKVNNSQCITIVSDEYSLENAKKILGIIAPIELQLRELAIYAYDLAARYKEIIPAKHKTVRRLIAENKLVANDTHDPLLAFLDFGELIDFLGKTGNQIDDSNLADDTARLIENSATFDDFKQAFTRKFKKQTVWDIIANAALKKHTDWNDLEQGLRRLKDIRNTALHHRVLPAGQVEECEVLAEEVREKMIRKSKPATIDIDRLDRVFDAWNKALTGYTTYQEHIQRLVESDSFARSITQAQDSAKRALQGFEYTNLHAPPNSTLQAMLKARLAVNGLGLDTWVDASNSQASADESDKNSSTDEQPAEPSSDGDAEEEKKT